MKNSRRRISIKNFLWNDYIALLAWMFPVVDFFIALFIYLFGFFPALRSGGEALTFNSLAFFIYMGIVALIVGAIVIYLRFQYINKFFAKGNETSGKIIKKMASKSGWRIYFTFEAGQSVYMNSAYVSKNKRTKSYKKGDEVTVLYLKRNPLKAILKDVYR